MWNIRIIRGLSLLIMLAAASTSFKTQRGLFLDWQVDEYTAFVAPLAVDLLAVICNLALHTDGMRKGVPVLVLIITGGASVAANWIAGVTVGAAAVHGGMVCLYLLAEWIASQKVRKLAEVAQGGSEPQVAESGIEEELRELAEVESNVPVSPAVVIAGPKGPYKGAEDYSDRHKSRLRKGAGR